MYIEERMADIQTIRLDVTSDPDFLFALKTAAVDYVCALESPRTVRSLVKEKIAEWLDGELSRFPSPQLHFEICRNENAIVLSASDPNGNCSLKREFSIV